MNQTNKVPCMQCNKFERLWETCGFLFEDYLKPSLAGRPPKHPFKEILRGIFWILDTGAQWRNLPKNDFPPRSTCHYWLQKWSREGLFDMLHTILVDLAKEEEPFDDGFIDAMFVRSKGARQDVGNTKAGKGSKMMAIVDGGGLPVALDVVSATPHESKCVDGVLRMKATEKPPKYLTGDKAYDSDPLDEKLLKKGVEMVSPHKENRKKPATQNLETLAEKYPRRHLVENFFASFQWARRVLVRYERKTINYVGFALFKASLVILQKFGLLSNKAQVEILG